MKNALIRDVIVYFIFLFSALFIKVENISLMQDLSYFVGIIALQIIITINMSIHIYIQLCNIDKEKKFKRAYCTLSIVRIISLIILNIFVPITTTIVDFLGLVFLYLKLRYKSNKLTNDKRKHIADFEEFEGDIPTFEFENKESLILDLVGKFKDYINSFYAFDYVSLDKICTEKLYKEVLKELTTYDRKNKIYKVRNFMDKESRIVNFVQSEDKYIIEVAISLSMIKYYTYVKNQENVIVDEEARNGKTYIVSFIKNNITNKGKNCLNCGAPLDEKLDKCLYCSTPLEKFEDEWLLDKIRCLGESRKIKKWESM